MTAGKLASSEAYRLGLTVSGQAAGDENRSCKGSFIIVLIWDLQGQSRYAFIRNVSIVVIIIMALDSSYRMVTACGQKHWGCSLRIPYVFHRVDFLQWRVSPYHPSIHSLAFLSLPFYIVAVTLTTATTNALGPPCILNDCSITTIDSSPSWPWDYKDLVLLLAMDICTNTNQ